MHVCCKQTSCCSKPIPVILDCRFASHQPGCKLACTMAILRAYPQHQGPWPGAPICMKVPWPHSLCYRLFYFCRFSICLVFSCHFTPCRCEGGQSNGSLNGGERMPALPMLQKWSKLLLCAAHCRTRGLGMGTMGLLGIKNAQETCKFRTAHDLALSASRVLPDAVEQPFTPSLAAPAASSHLIPSTLEQPQLLPQAQIGASPSFCLTRAGSLPGQFAPEATAITPSSVLQRASSTPSTCSSLTRLMQGCDLGECCKLQPLSHSGC